MFQPYRIKDQTISDTVGRKEALPRDGQASAVRIPSSTGINASPLVSLIGDTPLIPLTDLTRSVTPDVALLVKVEGLNPGGSVKDRPALSIVRSALRDGDLTRGRTLLDATSGNIGIAYAMLGAALGFPIHWIRSFGSVPRMLTRWRVSWRGEKGYSWAFRPRPPWWQRCK